MIKEEARNKIKFRPSPSKPVFVPIYMITEEQFREHVSQLAGILAGLKSDACARRRAAIIELERCYDKWHRIQYALLKE